VRSGVSLDELRSVKPSLIGYVQLCDGPLQAEEANYFHESASERLSPGKGAFSLGDILEIVPTGRPEAVIVDLASVYAISSVMVRLVCMD
jgi:hypothetical protein